MSKKIFAVITVFNRKEYTRDCLQCFVMQNDLDLHVIVVDDGSTDGTSEMIKRDFPSVTVLQGTGNLWWVGGTNLGIRHVLEFAGNEDYVLLMNNDLRFKDNYITQLREVSGEYPNALIGSLYVNSHDIILTGGVKFNWAWAKMNSIHQGKHVNQFDETHIEYVSVLSGRGTLIPIQVFHELGLYNERFEHAGDWDIPIRASKSGYSLLTAYAPRVYAPDELGLNINTRPKYTWKDAKEYFWGIRSYTNLRTRYHLSRIASDNFFGCTRFLVIDFARIIFHFLTRFGLR